MIPAVDWLQLGVAGGALGVLVMLARGFFRQNREMMSFQKEQQEQVLQFFGNHLGSVVDSQAHTARVLEGLTNEVRAMRYELRSTGKIDSRVDTE